MSEETNNDLPVEEISAPEEVPAEAPTSSEPPRPPEPVEPAEPAEAKVHPAYEKLLSELPEAWHEKIIPHLQEQDKSFQQQLEKFSPLKEFMEYDPAVLRDSLKLADVAVNDPVSLYRNLAEHLRGQGLIEEAEAADDAADEAEAAGEDGDYEIDPAIAKQFEKQNELIKQQQEYLESIEYQKQVDLESRQLEADISEMSKKYDIPDQTMDRILKLMEVQLDRGEEATVYTAARELAEITGVRYKVRGDLPKADAPTVMGSGGGAGIPTDPVSVPQDAKGKKAMLEQMFKAQLNNQ